MSIQLTRRGTYGENCKPEHGAYVTCVLKKFEGLVGQVTWVGPLDSDVYFWKKGDPDRNIVTYPSLLHMNLVPYCPELELLHEYSID